MLWGCGNNKKIKFLEQQDVILVTHGCRFTRSFTNERFLPMGINS